MKLGKTGVLTKKRKEMSSPKIDPNCLSDLKLILILLNSLFRYFSFMFQLFQVESVELPYVFLFFFLVFFSSVLCTHLRDILMSACRKGPILIED